MKDLKWPESGIKLFQYSNKNLKKFIRQQFSLLKVICNLLTNIYLDLQDLKKY